MNRILAIDYGLKRTGLAVSDEKQIIASGLTTVKTAHIFTFLKKYLCKENVESFLIGLPKRLNGKPSDIEHEIYEFIDELKKNFPKIPIKRIDERFTTKIAYKSMIDGGLKKMQRRNKALLDEISATIILQSYLYNK